MAKNAHAAKAASPTKPVVARGRGRPAGLPNKKRSDRKDGVRPKFQSYIYRVLKQIAPKTKISRNSIGIMNSFVNDLFEKIATESSTMVRYTRKSTLSAREVQAAVRLILPGELCKHAITEGTKAVTRLEG